MKSPIPRPALFPLALAGVTLTLIVAVGRADKGNAADGSHATLKGGWTSCETVTDSKQDGDNQLTTVTLAQKFEGAVDGTCDGSEREVVRKDGSRTFSGSGTFTGKINGRSGTVVLTHTGTVTKEGVTVADWILDHGTEELARIDGHGKSEGKRSDKSPDCGDATSQTAWSGKYVGEIEFGP